MRYLVPCLAAMLALGWLGCGGSRGQSPLAPITPETELTPIPVLPDITPDLPPPIGTVAANLGGVAAAGPQTESALAIYALDIDPEALIATSSLQQTRSAQATDDLYLLSINTFLTSDSLRIRSIVATAETVDLTYEFVHPFPAASDPAGTPNGYSNRADLGLAGRIVFLADVPSPTGYTYFDERATGGSRVIANTDLIVNPDAYCAPAGLLSLHGIANTFPYQVLVDETGYGNRLGTTNGGVATGNYGTDGWVRSEMNSGWSGYGLLHQGQVSTHKLSMRKSAMNGGFTLNVAVLAKYNDPRGGSTAAEKKANRLPSLNYDTSKFAYRMPHGALDVERIVYEGEVNGGFWKDLVSGSTLSFRVTDWDARAIPTTKEDLSLDADIHHVSKDEAGLPTLAVCIPGVLGNATVIDTWNPDLTIKNVDAGPNGDSMPEYGIPGDALYFEKLVTKGLVGSQTAGMYTGMVRAVDVEDGRVPLAQSLDEGFQIVTGNEPRPITYQVFRVPMIDPNDVPIATFSLTSNPILSGTSASIVALTYTDGDGDPITVDIDWNADGDFNDASEAGALVLPGAGGSPVIATSPFVYINTDLQDDVYALAVRYTDGVILAPVISPPLTLTVGANRPPIAVVSTLPAGTVPSGSLAGTVQLSIAAYNDPEGASVSMDIDWNNDADFLDPGELGNEVSGPTPLRFNSPLHYDNLTNASEVRSIPWRLRDGIHTTSLTSATFTLGANRAPTATVGLLPAGTILSGSVIGTVKLSVSAYNDPEAQSLLMDIDWNNDLDFTDAGESGNALTGSTPVSFSSPLKYDNPTASNQVRQIPWQLRDGVNTTASTSVSFTLGANRSPVVAAGTISLASSSLTTPATFSVTASGLSVSDPEGDAITYTVFGDADVGTDVTSTGLSGFPISNGSFTNPSTSSVIFTGFANDVLHTGVNGTSIPSSPNPLTGNVGGCSLNGSSVNTALATLNTSNALRTASTSVQAIGGVRVTWTTVAGATEYAVQRATWPVSPVTDPASLSFTSIGTTTGLTYNDTTINPSGTRYVYRVMPRCSIGGADSGSPTQLAIIMLQSFEGTTAGVNAMTTGANGWTGLAQSSTSTISTYNSGTSPATSPLSGNRDLSVYDINATANNPGWSCYATPFLNHRGSLGSLSESRLEFNFARRDGTSGSRVTVASRSDLPTAGTVTAGSGWLLLPSLLTSSFNVNTEGALTEFSGLSPYGGADIAWGSGSTISAQFVQVNANAATITNSHNYVMVILASNIGTSGTPSQNENVHIDDMAWIVY